MLENNVQPWRWKRMTVNANRRHFPAMQKECSWQQPGNCARSWLKQSGTAMWKNSMVWFREFMNTKLNLEWNTFIWDYPLISIKCNEYNATNERSTLKNIIKYIFCSQIFNNGHRRHLITAQTGPNLSTQCIFKIVL